MTRIIERLALVWLTPRHLGIDSIRSGRASCDRSISATHLSQRLPRAGSGRRIKSGRSLLTSETRSTSMAGGNAGLGSCRPASLRLNEPLASAMLLSKRPASKPARREAHRKVAIILALATRRANEGSDDGAGPVVIAIAAAPRTGASQLTGGLT